MDLLCAFEEVLAKLRTAGPAMFDRSDLTLASDRAAQDKLYQSLSSSLLLLRDRPWSLYPGGDELEKTFGKADITLTKLRRHLDEIWMPPSGGTKEKGITPQVREYRSSVRDSPNVTLERALQCVMAFS